MNGRRVDKSPTSTEATFNQPRLATIDLMRKVSATTHNTTVHVHAQTVYLLTLSGWTATKS